MCPIDDDDGQVRDYNNNGKGFFLQNLFLFLLIEYSFAYSVSWWDDIVRTDDCRGAVAIGWKDRNFSRKSIRIVEW